MAQDYSLKTKNDLATLLASNNGIVIIKFHATWCGPCKKIESLVHTHFSKLPDNVRTYEVDIDQAFELYGFLKTKKVVNGIPVMLAYFNENKHYIPDDLIIGTDEKKINDFFGRVIEEAKA
jgi:thiol:disulfide interchange protein